MIIQNFDLNLIPDSAPVVVHVDQYDHGTGRLRISLYEGDVPYEPSGTAQIQGKKPDGRGFLYNASLSGNIVTANLEEQMTAVAGKVLAQVVVTETSGRIGSFKFILDVQASALPDDTDMSESDYQAIEELIEEAQEVAQEVAEDKTAAENAATSAGNSAEDSEAWAKGTRNGTAVPPTDPTYQQNSKYWAGQAEQYAQGGLKFVGTIFFASLPTSGMRAGDMYNIKDAFTTDSRFEEGAGIRYPEGTNIAWTPNGKWDVLAGNIRVLVSITLAQFNALTPAQKNDPTIWWWVPDANNGTMGGSVSSVTAYPELTDLPSVNSHTIIGAMTSSALEIAGKIMPEGSTVYIDNQGAIGMVGKGAEIFNDYRTRGNNNNNGNVASGVYSHAEGNSTTAFGAYSHAEGCDTYANGQNSHAEGRSSIASGDNSHAEGRGSEATSNYSHAEGYDTTASGKGAHAEGYGTTASGEAAHAEGEYTTASAKCAHAGGYYTQATHYAQTAIGKYNTPKTNTLFEVGNGTSNARSNAFEVYENGDINVNGNIKAKGSNIFRSMGYAISVTPSNGSISCVPQGSAYFSGITSQATWDDNFSTYKPFSIINAEAGSPTTKEPGLIVKITAIGEDTDTGRIRVSGVIFNASTVTYIVSEIKVKVLCVTVGGNFNPITDYSNLQ